MIPLKYYPPLFAGILCNCLLFSNLCAQSLLKKGSGCAAATQSRDLDVNNVRARILNGGDMWWDLVSVARYEVPRVGNGQVQKCALKSGSLWVAGVSNGNLKIAAQTYRQQGNDYFPGPLNLTSASISAERCRAYDQIWSIKLTDLNDFRNNPSKWSTPSADISSWPCHGDPSFNESPFLAPFVDKNGNNIYEPALGDYPSLDQNNPNVPDQMMFIVYNDKGNIHSESEGLPLGLELRLQAFAFVTNDEINNTTFYRTTVIYRGPDIIDSCIFGQWTDPDLGNYADDLVGCDVTRSLGICYNGDDDDDGILGYGINPPCVGVRLFEGMKDTNGLDIGMKKFITYSDPGNGGNPTRPEHFWNYLNGRWSNGKPVTYGGTGMGGADTCSYMFPGQTDPAGRPEWIETPALEGNRRFIQSSGPYKLLPGAVNTISFAVVWAWTKSGGPTGSIQALKQASDKAYMLFKNHYAVNSTSIPASRIQRPVVFPNPGNQILMFSDLPENAYTISLFDNKGNLCLESNIHLNAGTNTSGLKNGIYYYRLSDKHGAVLTTGKWVKPDE